MDFWFWFSIFIVYQFLILLWVNREHTKWQRKLWRDLKKIKVIVL